MNPRVAVLGTGRMGSAIARRLADTGVELVVWNRTRSRAEAVGAGIVAGTPADAVASADVVITSLTGADALRETFGGPTGALARARGQTFVEMSTAVPATLEQLAPLVAKTGSKLVVFQFSIATDSRGASFVEREHATEPFASADAADGQGRIGRGEGDDVAQASVVALGVVVLDELAHDGAPSSS